MPFSPPLIKPPIPPPKAPPAPPFRIPPILREPPTQTDPQIDIPNKPPTEKDLLGVVCIYSNPPIYTPKKIRYRYPGGNWVEVEGESYSTEISQPQWNPLPIRIYRIDFRGEFNQNSTIINGFYTVSGGFTLTPVVRVWEVVAAGRLIYGDGYEVRDLNGTRLLGFLSNGPWPVREFTDRAPGSFFDIKKGTFSIVRVRDTTNNQEVPPNSQCRFRIFNSLNQVILDITNAVCPEVQVIPKLCEYKKENEKLVSRWLVSFFGRLYVEYQGNCATVKYQASPINPFPITVYRECSNANCPSPPRIRFDNKCEEPCEKCPPGTVIKVLQGQVIVCVDGNGCVLKRVPFKRGCESYDCTCD